MHRIRLHSQWQRDTSIPGVSRFFRAFHSPTGLQATDRVYLAAALEAEITWDQLTLKAWLNTKELNLQITDTLLLIELTSDLKPYNQIQFEVHTQLEGRNPAPAPMPISGTWPLENLALEIHSQLESE